MRRVVAAPSAVIQLERAGDLQKELYAHGLITNHTAGDVLRFLPPFTVSESEVDRALETLAAGLQALFS